MTDTSPRDLIRRLTEELDNLHCYYNVPDQSALIAEARAYLDQSVPEEPTDEELMALMPQQLRDDLATVSRLAAYGTDVAPGLYRVTLNTGILDHCRAVLARWGK
jgi:hypothetical protein